MVHSHQVSGALLWYDLVVEIRDDCAGRFDDFRRKIPSSRGLDDDSVVEYSMYDT